MMKNFSGTTKKLTSCLIMPECPSIKDVESLFKRFSIRCNAVCLKVHPLSFSLCTFVSCIQTSLLLWREQFYFCHRFMDHTSIPQNHVRILQIVMTTMANIGSIVMTSLETWWKSFAIWTNLTVSRHVPPSYFTSDNTCTFLWQYEPHTQPYNV